MTVTAYKPWRCAACGTVLGVVERNASREPVLYVLREPVESWHARPRDEVVVCEIEGAAKVYCPACGQVRRWVVKEEKDVEVSDGKQEWHVEGRKNDGI